MAQAVGLASMLPVDEDMEMTESGTENAAEVLHRSVFFNVSIDDVTKLLSGAFRDTGSGEVANFTSAQLREFSLDFKDRIGPFHFGAVYRGNINGKTPGSVLLKIWDDYYAIYLETRENPNIFIDEEAMFLKDKAIASHPSFPKVIGKCCSENLRGVVYDLDPLDSLQNMMPKNSFGWAQRIRVAVKLAQLLEFLHCQENPYVVLNLSAQHIMLDHMLNPVLIDFGLLSGGVIGELSFIKKRVALPQGYGDPDYVMGAPLHPCCDVYVYGMILVGIIAKRIVKEEDLDRYAPALDFWAEKEYKSGVPLVHKSLESEWGFHATDASSLTELAMWSMRAYGADRPTMTQVVDHLKKLQIVKDLVIV